jgi:hypothetical protein
LAYAGLEQLDVDVEPFATEAEVELGEVAEVRSHRKQGAAAWFRGIEEGCCLFGVELELVDDPERLVGALAHEVAHAWRFHHGLMVKDSELEEELTDLTTVYLGFGILTVNGTYRYRAKGDDIQGSLASTQWSFAQAGYLPLEAMCFLLAVQAVARRLESGEVRGLQRQLEPNQASSFRRALQELEKQGLDALAERLRLPPPERWPKAWTELPVPAALGGAPVSSPAPAPVAPPEEPASPLVRNKGRPVFRFQRSRLFASLMWPVGALLLASALKGLVVDTQGWLLLVPAAWVAAVTLKREYCSGTGCETLLKKGLTVCPMCGGTIIGAIPRLRDRFDAEADYWRKVRAQEGRIPEAHADALDDDEAPEEPPRRDAAS